MLQFLASWQVLMAVAMTLLALALLIEPAPLAPNERLSSYRLDPDTRSSLLSSSPSGLANDRGLIASLASARALTGDASSPCALPA